MRLALFEPDIPQNAGAMMRLGACLGVGVDLIEPCGFVIGSAAFRRAGMDYLDHVDWRRHSSWAHFHANACRPPARLVLLTTQAETGYTDFRFRETDILLLGRESAGVPDHVHELAGALISVPMAPHMRSLNVATAAAMVLGEALRQTGGLNNWRF